MRPVEFTRPVGRTILPVLALAVITGLAGCASSGGNSSGSGGLAGLFGGGNPNKNVVSVQSDSSYSTEMFLKQGYCPPVQIRAGTEQLRIYERGKQDDPSAIRYQASISETARECHAVGADTLSVRLGVAGRVVAGPKGAPGNVTLPIRVAVSKQSDNSVLFSQAFNVPASLKGTDLSVAFTQVFEQIQFRVGPADRDLIIFVGFDEGARGRR